MMNCSLHSVHEYKCVNGQISESEIEVLIIENGEYHVYEWVLS